MIDTEFARKVGLISLLHITLSTACANGTGPAPASVAEAWIPAYPEFMILTGEEVELTVEAFVAASGEVKEAHPCPLRARMRVVEALQREGPLLTLGVFIPDRRL